MLVKDEYRCWEKRRISQIEEKTSRNTGIIPFIYQLKWLLLQDEIDFSTAQLRDFAEKERNVAFAK